MALFFSDMDINELTSVLHKYKTPVKKVLYIDLLLSKYGLYQTLNSDDNAREACMGSWSLDVRFTLYLSTLRELNQLCSYTRWKVLEILFDYYK